MILTSNFNHNIQIIGKNSQESVLGNIIGTNSIGNGYSVGYTNYIYDGDGYLIDQISYTCTLKHVTIGTIDNQYTGTVTGTQMSGSVRLNITSASIGNINCSINDPSNTGSLAGEVVITGNAINCSVGAVTVTRGRSGNYDEELFQTETGGTISITNVNTVGNLTTRTNIAHAYNTVNIISVSGNCGNIAAAGVIAFRIAGTGSIFADTGNISTVTSGQQYTFYSPQVAVTSSELQYLTINRSDAKDNNSFRLTNTTINQFVFTDTTVTQPQQSYTIISCNFPNSINFTCTTLGNTILAMVNTNINNLYSGSVTLLRGIMRILTGQKEVLICKGITAATSFTFSPNHNFDSVVIRNNTANVVTGGIKLGSTNGGTEHLATIAVAGNANVSAVEGALSARYSTGTSTLYVGAVTAWNSASITIIINVTYFPTAIS